MTIQAYLNILDLRYKTGISREHTYRGDLQTLLMTLLPGILVTNEPSRVACGAPDYVLTSKNIPVGYIEAKDIGVDLDGKTLKEQFDRYRSGLSNLIFTDYLEFHFYRDGVFNTSIAIAKIERSSIVPLPENFGTFENLIRNFVETISQTIKSPTRLAEMMAGKAKLMADVIEKSLDSDDVNETRSSLKHQMLSFKQMLIHDIDNTAFADLYAQTIAYGMFAARYHDPTLPTFSREEAATLIPKSNPFLRKLFQDVAGYDLDERLIWIVDELVNIFRASDVASIMQNFGRTTRQEDPVIHFYETFLAAYNRDLRKKRGVWYTPQPVVSFIVRAVDAILKTEFNLPYGLADTSKIKVKTKHITKATSDQRSKLKEVEVEREVHKVQILDPATGTGTFLAETVRHIHKSFEGQQGIWNNYVNQHLIPRLNGFELLMASYAMAHLKMDMLLTETGYKATNDQRFRIFLTNSLEESHADTGTLFSSWLSDEADQANAVKRETPVMVVMGNPPYSVSSTNKSKWIENLLIDYKKDMKERNIQPLSDDYIKFIRFGQHFIDKNGEGVLAYISNNSFIDGIIHRQMRKHLLESFDKVFILDLHGNAKKNEICLNGSADQNVFDIMQGVSVNIFIKTGKKKKNELAKLFNYNLYGQRQFKYDWLNDNSMSDINWDTLDVKEPNYFFVNKNFNGTQAYEKGFKIDELFSINSVGIVTSKDAVLINEDAVSLMENVTLNYNIKFNSALNKRISYRVFDDRLIYYDIKLIDRARDNVMKHMLKPNLALVAPKQAIKGFKHVFISNTICDKNLIDSAGQFGAGNVFPLYLYRKDEGQQNLDNDLKRTPNLNSAIISQLAEKIALTFTNEKEPTEGTFSPIDVLDYIYAVLHSPSYRDIYKEFLKIDFPRVSYPTNTIEFWRLVRIGEKLRQIHLFESSETNKYITQYPIDGNNEVTKVKYDGSKVYINDVQYFENVPETAWNFYIGGYQPAQKWLKDRKGRILHFEDVLHYQKIILALKKTTELMEEIDLVTQL
jgi:predicted helicase